MLDRLKAGESLSIQHTKYTDGSELYHSGGFAGDRRSVPAKTILALVEKSIICEASRYNWSSITDGVIYQISEVK